MKENLRRVAAEVDSRFPDNECLRIEDGEPILSRLIDDNYFSRPAIIRIPGP